MAEGETSAAEEATHMEKVVEKDSKYLVDGWLEALSEHTFETHFVALSEAHADAILRHHKLTAVPASLLSIEQQAALGRNQAVLDDLAASIDEAIAKVGGVAFVRLSSRSPKDAVLQSGRMEACFAELQAEVRADYPQGDEIELERIAFIRACGRALRVKTGKEALDLFVASMRVHDDLSTARRVYGEDVGIQVIVRRWEDLAFEWEFRTFVMNGQITAITQYYESCFVSKIASSVDAIRAVIFEHFESIKDLIPLQNFTIDYALDPQLSKVWVIEINHPPPIAGQSMFDWKDPHDQKILSEGPFEMRVQLSQLDDPWKDHRVLYQRLKESIKRGRSANKKAPTRSRGGSF